MMETIAPSGFSLAAACLYVVVALAAGMMGVQASWRGPKAWHRWLWGTVGLAFVAFALMRVFAVEEWLRSDLRFVLRHMGAYDVRRYIQVCLIAVLLMIALGMAAGVHRLVARGLVRRDDFAAIGAFGFTCAMILLAAIRLVSLHFVDALLFGPLRLNWFLDLGLTLAVLGCALVHRKTERLRTD